MKRRAFLQSSAGVVVGFSLSLSPVLAQQAADPRFAQVDAWLKIAPNGQITFHTGKVELGTGVRTALAQRPDAVAHAASEAGAGTGPSDSRG